MPGSKMGKGVGRGQGPTVETEEDLLQRGWGVNEFRQLDYDHMVKAPTLKECKEEVQAVAAGRKLPLECSALPDAAARGSMPCTNEGTGGGEGGDAAGSRGVGAANIAGTGYYGRVSDLNWSPHERVLYNIPPDPQVCPCPCCASSSSTAVPLFITSASASVRQNGMHADPSLAPEPQTPASIMTHCISCGVARPGCFAL